VYVEDREDKTYSDEVIKAKPCQPFSMDEGNIVENVYHAKFDYISYSFWNSRYLLGPQIVPFLPILFAIVIPFITCI
jgi:hypothetical protein